MISFICMKFVNPVLFIELVANSLLFKITICYVTFWLLQNKPIIRLIKVPLCFLYAGMYIVSCDLIHIFLVNNWGKP